MSRDRGLGAHPRRRALRRAGVRVLESGSGTDILRIQVPAQEQCVAVKRFLETLDALVSDGLHVGDCTRILKEPDQPTPVVAVPIPPAPILTGP